MGVWEWIDYLARAVKKTANESQQNYQQVHAYIDGHDKETINQLSNKVQDSIKLRSQNGTVYTFFVDDEGNLKRK